MWVAALESGEYKQGRCKLRGLDGGFCCLGVLCDLHAKATGKEWVVDGNPDTIRYTYDGAGGALPHVVREWAGLPNGFGDYVNIDGKNDALDCHNDAGVPFVDIAKAIREQL